MQPTGIVVVNIVNFSGEHEGARFATICRAKCAWLGAACLVLRHHRTVLLDCNGGALNCILGGARKPMAQQLQKAVRPRQGPHLKYVCGTCAQGQEPVRGFDATENNVGGHELREASDIRNITAVRNICWQCGAQGQQKQYWHNRGMM